MKFAYFLIGAAAVSAQTCVSSAMPNFDVVVCNPDVPADGIFLAGECLGLVCPRDTSTCCEIQPNVFDCCTLDETCNACTAEDNINLSQCGDSVAGGFRNKYCGAATEPPAPAPTVYQIDPSMFCCLGRGNCIGAPKTECSPGQSCCSANGDNSAPADDGSGGFVCCAARNDCKLDPNNPNLENACIPDTLEPTPAVSPTSAEPTPAMSPVASPTAEVSPTAGPDRDPSNDDDDDDLILFLWWSRLFG
jgi:hypothetical protein